MALNQEQRKHAIEEIKQAAKLKRNNYRQPYPNATKFIGDSLKKSKIDKISVKSLLALEGESKPNSSYWCNDSGKSYQRMSAYQLDLYKVIQNYTSIDLEAEYNKVCDDQDNDYEIAVAAINELEKELISKVMYGNDYAVIAEALDAISSFQ